MTIAMDRGILLCELYCFQDNWMRQAKKGGKGKNSCCETHTLVSVKMKHERSMSATRASQRKYTNPPSKPSTEKIKSFFFKERGFEKAQLTH